MRDVNTIPGQEKVRDLRKHEVTKSKGDSGQMDESRLGGDRAGQQDFILLLRMVYNLKL